MRKIVRFVVAGAAVVVLVLCLAVGLIVYGVGEVATGQMGMEQLSLPSGASVWIRRQSYAHTPEHLYISASDDYCAPYDRWHDVELPRTVTGAEDRPLLLSLSGDTIVIHATEKPRQPWLGHSNSFKVEFEVITPSETASYAARSAQLPPGWQRVEVPWGHNTCSL